MSSNAMQSYLYKILKEFSKNTTETRSAQQKRKQHYLDTDISYINSAIDRYKELYEVDDTVSDALDYFGETLKKELEPLAGRGDLTFAEILKARATSGNLETLRSTKGGEYKAYVLKSRTGESVTLDDGTKIDLKNILQLGHDESISSIQAKAILNKLIRYRESAIQGKHSKKTKLEQKTIDADIRLIDAAINIFEKTILLLEKVDDEKYLEETLGIPFSKLSTDKGLVSKILNNYIKTGDLKINLTSTPTLTYKKHKTPKGVTFELAIDNGLKGNISSGIKQVAIQGLGLLIRNTFNLRLGRPVAPAGLSGIENILSSNSNSVNTIIDNTSWIHEKGSISYLEDMKYRLLEALDPKLKGKLPKFTNNSVKVTGNTINLVNSIHKTKGIKKINTKTPKSLSIPLRDLQGKFTSVTILENLIRSQLRPTIVKNMHRPNLNYQTGRFADSVELKAISRARDGALTAFLSYMKYPYATFEKDGKQGRAGYYPSRLIEGSVREIARGLVKDRLRVVV